MSGRYFPLGGRGTHEGEGFRRGSASAGAGALLCGRAAPLLRATTRRANRIDCTLVGRQSNIDCTSSAEPHRLLRACEQAGQ
jgi:hypothetical protein